jgi:hypothetical protein
MHISLTTRANIVLIVLWAVILAGMLITNWPQPLAPVETAFALGIVTGILQTYAMKEARDQFRQAATARETRRVLVSTKPGKLAIFLLWATAIGMLIWSYLLAPQAPLVLWIPTYASFALARELTSLPAVMRLAASS